jgi:GNAT superfamily N-acetyltransferase
MTRGFDTEIFFGEPYNRPWYPALFAHAGFAPRKIWNSVEVAGSASLETLAARSAAASARAGAAGWRFAPIDLRDPARARELQRAIDDAYRGSLGFAPLSPGEFAELLAGYVRAHDPRFALGARRPGGALAGFALAYPDHAPALRAMGGRDTPAARLRFWWRSRSRRRAVFFMIGVTAAEAGRGLGSALHHACLRELLAAGYDSVVFALLAEDSAGWRLLGDSGAPPRKQYALFSAQRGP